MMWTRLNPVCRTGAWIAFGIGVSGTGCLLSSDGVTDEFLQPSSIDVLFVVDNSNSMQGGGQEQERVIASFDDFVDNLEEQTADFHIGVTTTDMDTDTSDGGTMGRLKEALGVRYITSEMDSETYGSIFAEMVRTLGNGQGWEKGLWAAWAALYPEAEGGQADGWNEGFLRDEAALAIIFVSDEDDCSDSVDPLPGEEQAECYYMDEQLDPVDYYAIEYDALKQERELVSVHAVVAPSGLDKSTECGASTSAGVRYIKAVELLGGVEADICEINYDAIMNEILGDGAPRTVFVLSSVPRVVSLEVTVDGVPKESEGRWSYDSAVNAVVFFDDEAPAPGATVRISYRRASTQE